MASTRHRAPGSRQPPPVSEVLCDLRRRSGRSRHDLAYDSGVTAAELRSFERGTSTPSAEVRRRLATALAVDPEVLVPARSAVVVEHDALIVNGQTRPLHTGDTEEILREYLAVLYEMRHPRPGSKVPLREHDVAALAAALGPDADPETIETRLIELMGVSREQAARMRSIISKRPVAAPAARVTLEASPAFAGVQAPSPSPPSSNPVAHVAAPSPDDRTSPIVADGMPPAQDPTGGGPHVP
ncbi:MAG TPA: helix-turn-helix transcriptional regulator [Acidimicrobiia bacterium]